MPVRGGDQMASSSYLHLDHNVSYLVYPLKTRRIVACGCYGFLLNWLLRFYQAQAQPMHKVDGNLSKLTYPHQFLI